MINKVKQFTAYMSLSLTERQAHIDLTTSCIAATAKYAQGQRRQAKSNLIQYLGMVRGKQKLNGLDMQCCHLCPNNSANKTYDIPVCVNPQHIYLGTDAENRMDERFIGCESRGFSGG